MIVAVADYVDEKIDLPPLELKYALQSYKHGGLPNSGGLRDQPAGLMLRMSAAYNVWNAHSSYKSAQFNPEWIKSNPGLMQIIGEVASLRAKLEGNK